MRSRHASMPERLANSEICCNATDSLNGTEGEAVQYVGLSGS
jgi:hypothetical protein